MDGENSIDESLTLLGVAVLDLVPDTALPPDLVKSLRYPTLGTLRGAAEALFADGHLDAAEMLFAALSRHPGHEPWASIGSARLIAKRGDMHAAVSAWRACLHRFPDGAKPAWFVELARAERACGLIPDAETTLHRCRKSFPDFSPAAVTLAELLAGTDRTDEAAAAWRFVLDRFPNEAQPGWYVSFAALLNKTGQTERETQVVDDLARRFPDAPLTLVSQARLAARRENWAGAQAFWTALCDRHADQMQLEWLLGRATALLRQAEPEAALAAWQDAIDRFPSAPAARAAKATAFQELGMWREAERLLTDLIDRFPDQRTASWLAQLVRCQVHQRRNDAAAEVIARLAREFPQSSLHARLALDQAMRSNPGLDTLAPLAAEGAACFPEDRGLSCRLAGILMACGRFADAEAVAARLEATGDDHFAAIARWRIILDRDGHASLRDAVLKTLDHRAWPLDGVLAVNEFLFGLWSIWANDLALVLIDNAMAQFPGRIALHCARAAILIALDRYTLAIEVIDAIPALYQTREVLQLRAWEAARRDELSIARTYWQRILSQNHCMSLHGPTPSLHLVTVERELQEIAGVTVFLPVRNELGRLLEFMTHHRSLGARRFVAVDNMSTDGSFDYLREQPDVILYRTEDNFQAAGNGMRWINWLIQRHGNGGWCLFADADEAFIYPGWESLSLARFCAYLDEAGAEGVAAFMLDLYPERLWDEAGKPAKHAEYRYYDGDYCWLGHVNSPYRQPVGGVRARLFRAEEYLHKVPLIKSSRGVYVGNHETTPLRLASVTGAVCHYKLLSLAEKHSNPGLRAGGNPFMADVNPEMMRRYERYNSQLERLVGIDLRAPGVTRELGDSMALADQGLMQAPNAFRRWLAEAARWLPDRA